MSNEISQLEADLANLEAALKSGVMTVTVDGETTTFDTEAGLRNRIGYFEKKLARLRQIQDRKPFSGDIRISSGRYIRGKGCNT